MNHHRPTAYGVVTSIVIIVGCIVDDYSFISSIAWIWRSASRFVGWFYDIILTIQIFVADNLHSHSSRLIFPDFNNSYILVLFLVNGNLQNNKVRVAILLTDYFDVVNIPIVIQIKIIDRIGFVVNRPLKIF